MDWVTSAVCNTDLGRLACAVKLHCSALMESSWNEDTRTLCSPLGTALQAPHKPPACLQNADYFSADACSSWLTWEKYFTALPEKMRATLAPRPNSG